MFNIKKTDYGFYMKFAGSMRNQDIKDWMVESIRELDSAQGKFALMMDFRACDFLGDKAKETLDMARRVFFRKGLRRSVMVFKEANMARGFRAAAKQLGFDEWERYLCTADKDWEQLALDWLLYARDPDRAVSH